MIARLTTRWRAMRRWKRWVVGVGMVLAAPTTLGLVLLWLTRSRPSWWTEVDASDPAIIRAAETVENAAITQFSLARPADPDQPPESWRSLPWSVAITEADANAWLNARLPQWLANRERQVLWPRELAQVQVDFSGGAMRVGIEIGPPGHRQYLVAQVRPEVRAGGELWLPAERLQVGGLALPADWILGRVRGRLHDYLPPEVADLPETRALMDIFEGRRPLIQFAAIRLDDGRRVRILSMTPRRGRLELVFRTERPR